MLAELAVDERLHALVELRLQLGGLRLRDPPVGDRFVDLLRLHRDERVDEAGDTLAFLLGDVGKGLVVERLTEIRLAHTKIRRSRREELEVAVMTELAPIGAAMSEEQRVLVRIDPLLELRGLFLGQRPGVDGLVDAVLEGLLERVRERLRLDAELGRGVVDDRLALLARWQHPRSSDRSSRAEPDDERCDRSAAGDERDLPASVHASHVITRD